MQHRRTAATLGLFALLCGEASATARAQTPRPSGPTVEQTDGDDRLAGGRTGDVLDGGHGDDVVLGAGGDDLLFGSSGADALFGEDGKDRLFLGPGNDQGSGGDHSDLLVGGPGDDHLDGGPGHDRLRGQAGDDTLLGGPGSDRLLGGAGADHLDGGPGRDELVPGTGADLVRAGDGDDEIRIASPCELAPGELLDGGGGEDTLYTHLSRDQLRDRGVTVTNIERVVLLRGAPNERACTRHDGVDGYVEVLGVVAARASFWRDASGRDTELDGTRPTGRGVDLFTRTEIRVDAVAADDGGILSAGQTLSLVTPGGSATLDDGRTLSTQACCARSLSIGSTVRLHLEWNRAKSEFRYAKEFGTDPRSTPAFDVSATRTAGRRR